MKAKKAGRPAKITAAVVELVAETMALGVPEAFACELHGVNPETFGPAVARSEQFKAIKRRHDARFIERAVKAIADGGEKGIITDAEGLPREFRKPWQGMAWLLERRHWREFCVKAQHEVKAEVHSAAFTLSPEQEAELQRMARRMYVERTGDKE